MEEVEWIHTENSVFETYIGIVAAMLEQASNRLYIGPVLDGLSTDRLKRRLSKRRHLEVSNDRAATMFYMNIQSWKHQPFIQRNYSAAMIQQLELDLRDLSEGGNDKAEIKWGLWQIAYEKKVS